MSQQLSLSARPQTLDALIGQKKTVEAIRGHMKSGRVPKAWMFYGPFGTGKTSIARILALSYQCEHQDKTINGVYRPFGHPCRECRANKDQFQIYEIKAADASGIDKMRELLQGADYGVLGAGKYRVYIIDEVQRASANAQDLMLKLMEDTPQSTIFILCTTRPYKLDDALRSRCTSYEMRGLDADDAEVLVKKLLKKVGSNLPVDRFMDALIAKQVRSPRLIAQAVEKYVSGQTPEESANVAGTTDLVDIEVLTRNVIKGDWSAVSDVLFDTQTVDARAVRLSVVSYLQGILLRDKELGERTKVVTDAIMELAHVQNSEDKVVSAVIAAALYRVTAMFAEYKR